MRELLTCALAVILGCALHADPVPIGSGGPNGAPVSAFIIDREVYVLLNYFAAYNNGPMVSGCAFVQRSDGEQFAVHLQWIYELDSMVWYEYTSGAPPGSAHPTYIYEQMTFSVYFITDLGQNFYTP